MRSMIPAPFSATPALDRTVVFANLPPDANDIWLRSVLAPIGMVQSVEFSQGPGGTLQAKVAFPSPEQAQAAMHFHGHLAFGQPMQLQLPPDTFLKGPQQMLQPQMGRYPLALNVDLNSHHGGRPRIAGQPSLAGQRHRGVEVEPTHKNLYVLNLPLDATTDQLAALFANYGGVVHCVILAMLDAQARRRGFIDMASPSHAKEAIEALNGFVWHGYPIEVSYAIVQRSGGPFEHATGRHVIKRNVPRNRFNTGPRRVPSDAMVSPMVAGRHPALMDAGMSGALISPNGIVGYPAGPSAGHPVLDPALAAANGAYTDMHQGNFNATPSPMGPEVMSNGMSTADPRALFISGLDPVAILDEDDFRNALENYGPTSAVWLNRDGSGMSRGFGMVIFVHETSARRAKADLDGKMINGRKISAYNVPLNRNISELLPLSVNNSSTSSPTGASSALGSGLSLADVSSFNSSPEYRRNGQGYSVTGTPASNVPSLPSSTSASLNGLAHPAFSTPQPLSSASSGSDLLKQALPPMPATEGALPSSGSNGRGSNFAYHLGFSPEPWTGSSSASRAAANSPGGSGLAEPFVPRSTSGSSLGASAQTGATSNPGAPGAESASKNVYLGSAFESPSVNTLSPTTLKTNPGTFPTGVNVGSSGSRGPLDAGTSEFYPGTTSKVEAAPQPSGTQSANVGSRPRSRNTGSLGVTLGSDMAASMAAAAGAPPTALSSQVASRPSQTGGYGDATAGGRAQNDGGGIVDATPKLDGAPFAALVHSTPLSRRGHGQGHAHMYSHLTRSAGAGNSIGSIGSISHAGSTSALSANSWARTPQSSLSSLEQVSPGSGTSALGKGTPGGSSAFKQHFDVASSAVAETAGHAGFSFPGSDHTLKGVSYGSSSATSSPWAGFPAGGAGGGSSVVGNSAMSAPWTSPQVVAGSFSSKDGGERRGADGREGTLIPPAPGSTSSSLTETGSHSALRSLHQGSPPYSAALDSRVRRVPMAPVGHEKSASISSPRARLSSGSTNGSGLPRNGPAGSQGSDKAAADLAGAIGGLNIST